MKMGGKWVDCNLIASWIWDSDRDSDKEEGGEARIARVGSSGALGEPVKGVATPALTSLDHCHLRLIEIHLHPVNKLPSNFLPLIIH